MKLDPGTNDADIGDEELADGELHGERDLGDHQSSMHIFAQKQSRKE